MAECGVCMEDLSSPSAFGADGRAPDPVTTLCGHLFHSVCLEKAGEQSQSCPMCRKDDQVEFKVRIYPSKTTEVDDLLEKIKSIELERDNAVIANEKLNKEVSNLKDELAASGTRIRDFGARISFDGRSCADSTCKNCESTEHRSGACPNPPYLRNRDETDYGKYVPTRRYSFIGKLPGSTAGEITSKFETKFGMEFSRAQIQVVYAFAFFDHVCFGCFSPFHENNDCRCRRNPDPGAKKVARMMRIENHPLSPEKFEKRLQKNKKYGKK